MRLTMHRTTKIVTEKNTKQEILSAYQELLEQITPATAEASTLVKEETVVLDNASKETVEKITEELGKLKISFNQAISSFTELLTAEADRLAMLRKASMVAEKELEERQKIKVTAGLLERMIAAQKEREAAFEKDMADRKEAWEKEQQDHEEKIARERKREEEEYRYTQQLERKRIADERENERLARDRKAQEEKEAREALISELNELRKKAAAAPTETERSVKDAVVKAVAQAQADAAVKAQLIKQQADADLNLAQVKINTLESAVKAQTQEIILLKKQLEDATRQVKDIAVSVIESNRTEQSSSSPAK